MLWRSLCLFGTRFLAQLALVVSRRVRPDGAVEARDRDAVVIALAAAILAVTTLLAVAGALATPTLAALSPLALLMRRTKE